MKDLNPSIQQNVCKINSIDHTICEHCSPESELRFSYQHFELDKEYASNYLRHDAFVIVTKGCIELTVNGQKKILNSNEMMVLQLFSTISFKALADSYVFSFKYIINRNHPCIKRKLNYNYYRHSEQPHHLSVPLKMTPAMSAYIESLRHLLDCMPDCTMMYRNKCFEFGTFLAAQYDKQSLQDFLFPLFRVDHDLVSSLNSGLEHFVTTKDMAEWVETPLSLFEERFRKSFEEDPQHWLDRQRVELVRQYIANFPCSASEIIKRFSFCSEDHFDHHCQHHHQQSSDSLITSLSKQRTEFPLF